MVEENPRRTNQIKKIRETLTLLSLGDLEVSKKKSLEFHLIQAKNA